MQLKDKVAIITGAASSANVICPGFVRTPLVDKQMAGARAADPLTRIVGLPNPGLAPESNAPVGREGQLERVGQAVPLRRFVATGALYTGFEFDPTGGRQCLRCRYAQTVRRYRGQLFGGQARPRYRARHGDYEGCDRAPTVWAPS